MSLIASAPVFPTSGVTSASLGFCVGTQPNAEIINIDAIKHIAMRFSSFIFASSSFMMIILLLD